jgi:hypothetical protein
MGLYVHLDITAGREGMKSLGVLEILRQEPLLDQEDHSDEIHEYVAKVHDGVLVAAAARFSHRYGDGAWALVHRALEALHE